MIHKNISFIFFCFLFVGICLPRKILGAHNQFQTPGFIPPYSPQQINPAMFFGPQSLPAADGHSGGGIPPVLMGGGMGMAMFAALYVFNNPAIWQAMKNSLVCIGAQTVAKNVGNGISYSWHSLLHPFGRGRFAAEEANAAQAKKDNEDLIKFQANAPVLTRQIKDLEEQIRKLQDEKLLWDEDHKDFIAQVASYKVKVETFQKQILSHEITEKNLRVELEDNRTKYSGELKSLTAKLLAASKFEDLLKQNEKLLVEEKERFNEIKNKYDALQADYEKLRIEKLTNSSGHQEKHSDHEKKILILEKDLESEKKNVIRLEGCVNSLTTKLNKWKTNCKSVRKERDDWQLKYNKLLQSQKGALSAMAASMAYQSNPRQFPTLDNKPYNNPNFDQ